MSAVDRVTSVLRAAGVDPEVREFSAGTRTAQEAAAAVGCEVGQICKSLVFRVGDAPLLVIASGANRVDEGRFGAVMADARWVRDQTGFDWEPTHPRPARGPRPPARHRGRRGPAALRPRVGGRGHPARGVRDRSGDRLVAVTGARVARVSPGT